MKLKELLSIYQNEIDENPSAHSPRISIRLKDNRYIISGWSDAVYNNIITHYPGLLKKKVHDYYDDSVSLHFVIIMDCYAI